MLIFLVYYPMIGKNVYYIIIFVIYYLFLLLFKFMLIEKADVVKYLNKQFDIGENINM